MSDDRNRTLIASLQEAIDAVPEAPHTESDSGAPVDEDGAPLDTDTDFRDAMKRAYSILALRDHSRDELRQKLLRKEHTEDAVERLLDRLESARLLDDQHFAEQFVRSQREGKGKSQAAIGRALRDRGVDAEIIQNVLEDQGDDFPYALAVAQKKAASSRGLAPDVRLRRMLGVLARRGFSGSIARRAAERALNDHFDN